MFLCDMRWKSFTQNVNLIAHVRMCICERKAVFVSWDRKRPFSQNDRLMRNMMHEDSHKGIAVFMLYP